MMVCPEATPSRAVMREKYFIVTEFSTVIETEIGKNGIEKENK